MDATYKMTCYAPPLFFLYVRTNVSFQVVGTFVVQYSTTEAISVALKIFRMWNPTWQPRYFMTDFAEEEIHAIEDLFEGRSSDSSIYLYRALWYVPFTSNFHSCLYNSIETLNMLSFSSELKQPSLEAPDNLRQHCF